MPFTPKFVDMVRNLTTSTGTGAVNLGSAVSGFTSFTAAVATGEQFYYCIQGVNKPAEREVGRGTMQANGRIAREAISGSLTNFTSGTKTIALVTAAEWFAKVEAGGGGGEDFTVPTLPELAALPTAEGAAAMLTAKGREGLFVFDASNLSAKVTADTRQGIYVAPAAAPTGASGAWVRRFDGAVQLRWFGAVADFVTDDLPAFNAAHDLIKALRSSIAGLAVLDLGPHKYYFSDTANVHTPLRIVGAGGLNEATTIRFGKNKTGFVFNYTNTHGEGAGTQGNAEGSSMRGVSLYGGNVNVNGSGTPTTFGAGDSTSGHGIRIRCTFVTLEDVFVACFGGSGINIVASNGSGAGTTGNANNFTLRNCSVLYCRGFGYEISGSDANAGVIDICSVISCGAGGFIEYSFLGNTYIQCHARDCGKTDPTGSNGPVGICLYGGNAYYLVAGQDASASTTVPGTNSAVWAPYYGGGAARTWVTGQTWVNPSPYGTNPANVNGRNVFLGCYAESGQAPCQATYPSLFLGGLLDEVNVVGSATWTRGTSNGGIGCGDFVSLNPADGNNRTYFGNPDGKIIFDHRRAGSVAKFRGRDDFFGKKSLELQLDNSFEALNVGLEATHPYGYGAVAIARLFVGAGGVNTAIRLGALNAVADINGQTVAAGATFLDLGPVAGAAAGWVCTTGGTVGSGAVFADLPPLGLAESTMAEIHIGAATNRFISPDKLFDAAAPVTLTDAASVTIDGAAGINFNLTLGGNRTLANPVGMKPGQSGRVRVAQDATGGRTLAFGSNWLFAGGDPTLSTAANAIDVIAYFANSSSEIEATIVKALA